MGVQRVQLRESGEIFRGLDALLDCDDLDVRAIAQRHERIVSTARMLTAGNGFDAGRFLECLHAPIEIVDAEQDVIDLSRRRRCCGWEWNGGEQRKSGNQFRCEPLSRHDPSSLLEPIDDLLEPRVIAQRREIVVIEHPHAIAAAGADGAIEEIQRAIVFPAERGSTSRRV
jgi:hypothetical protein